MAESSSGEQPREGDDGTNDGGPTPDRGAAPLKRKPARELGSQPEDSLEEQGHSALPAPEMPEATATTSEAGGEEVPSAEVIAAWLAGPDDEARSKVPAEWNVGDLILDIYEVLGHASGAMGTVYHVRHLDWEMELAIKSAQRPRRLLSESDEQYEVRWRDVVLRFFEECSEWIQLGLYPHIASCFAVEILGGVPRALIEWVPGGSLRDWIGDNRLYQGGHRAALARILDIAIQAAWGLHHLHEQVDPDDPKKKRGLVHQDVKPGNILIPTDYLEKSRSRYKGDRLRGRKAASRPDASLTRLNCSRGRLDSRS